ncbi:sulfatase-like hydrolase/transferase [Aquabacterium sp.]|uniref:sulfatase-like hydrolase/transferase n=1 Tax=Aquabacterium sp. TaxID=1872578 RepID=UPI002C7DC414|nr:sulfatase-like hydrolase/transferase [Aquabacterium sp.]HSW05276.1 sulfatase-like hydrolase/transferase [Aquabacterium sp.]
MNLNHIVFIVMDSCRYDAFVAAKTPHIDRLGEAERRFSYASWTAPSHYVFTMGMMPHSSPRDVFASEVYKSEYLQWKDRIGTDAIEFKNFLPELSLPKVLSKLGYRTTAKVSMPVLNKYTLISQHFDEYKLMDNHNNFAGMVEEIEFPDDEPQYYFLNLGETHYPYMLSGENLPHISGVHGAVKGLGKDPNLAVSGEKQVFEPEMLKMLQAQQIKCVEYIDGLVGKLFEKSPPNTWFIVTADHGELFGEEGYFGHGPIMHEKCFEVPYVEGRLK